jgi:hypothetical protein
MPAVHGNHILCCLHYCNIGAVLDFPVISFIIIIIILYMKIVDVYLFVVFLFTVDLDHIEMVVCVCVRCSYARHVLIMVEQN